MDPRQAYAYRMIRFAELQKSVEVAALLEEDAATRYAPRAPPPQRMVTPPVTTRNSSPPHPKRSSPEDSAPTPRHARRQRRFTTGDLEDWMLANNVTRETMFEATRPQPVVEAAVPAVPVTPIAPALAATLPIAPAVPIAPPRPPVVVAQRAPSVLRSFASSAFEGAWETMCTSLLGPQQQPRPPAEKPQYATPVVAYEPRPPPPHNVVVQGVVRQELGEEDEKEGGRTTSLSPPPPPPRSSPVQETEQGVLALGAPIGEVPQPPIHGGNISARETTSSAEAAAAPATSERSDEPAVEVLGSEAAELEFLERFFTDSLSVSNTPIALRKEGESSGTTSNTDGGDRDPSQLLPPASLNTLAPFEGDGYNWSLTSVARAKAMMGNDNEEEEYETGLS